MTIRSCYEAALIECNKLKAPSILLEDFIYLFNKAIQQYANLVYNRAEFNQQSSDDLNFLQTTEIIDYDESIDPIQQFNDTIWRLKLPKDYLHLLNCIAEFQSDGSDGSRCGRGMIKNVTSPCNRLTADLYPGILNNYYMRPSHKKPYYYIVNNNPEDKSSEKDYEVSNPKMDEEIEAGSYNPNLIGVNEYRFYAMKEQGDRTSNQSTVNIEIHSGNST